MPGLGRLTEACASLEGVSLASSQDIDQMLAALPFPGHTLVFPLKGLMVLPGFAHRGLLDLKVK